MSQVDEILAMMGQKKAEESVVLDEDDGDLQEEQVDEGGEIEDALLNEVDDTGDDERIRSLTASLAQQTQEIEALRQQLQQAIGVVAQKVEPPPPVFDTEKLRQAVYDQDADVIVEAFGKLAEMINHQKESIREGILRDLPTVATNVTRQQMVLAKAVDAFYSENPDLVPYANMVGAMANKIVAADPAKPLPELFEAAASEVRKQLGMKKDAAKKKANSTPPAFPKGGGSRTGGGPQIVDPLKNDLAKMQKVVARR